MKKYLIFLCAFNFWVISLFAQDTQSQPARANLTVKKIMQNPLESVGSLPHDIYWSDDSKWIYFSWNPQKAESDSLYVVSRNGGKPRKLSLKERQALPASGGDFNKRRTQKVYQKHGDIFLLEIRKGKIRQILNTVDRESQPAFTHDEKGVTFIREDNIYLWRFSDGLTAQLTDFRSGDKPDEKKDPANANEKWLKQEEAQLIGVLQERARKSELNKENRKRERPDRPLKIYLGKQRLEDQQLSPNQRYVTFRLVEPAKDAKQTIVPQYVTEAGFTKKLEAREKVGSPQDQYRFGIYDTQRDTVYYLDPKDIPGIYDIPVFGEKEPEKESQEGLEEEKKKPRNVVVYGPYWSDNGEKALVVVRAWDNKDRWIMLLDPQSGKLTNLDRQHDDAWIGGPGISGWTFYPGNAGWMPDNRRVWFHSEETGYSHLYTVDVISKQKKALTGGQWEVTAAQISHNKKYWYLTTSEVHPGERHFYRMAIDGGKRSKITAMTGNNQATLSPDEKMLAIRFSYSNKPWQLYLMPNKPGAGAKQVTDALAEQFKSYHWRDPQIVTFKAEDGTEVLARYYAPGNPNSDNLLNAGGPAVIFVHGAGYLQNVHKWWSSYFREYMFHNLLADHGYTVLDIDYRGSAGYGRDWRTAIYRRMGGKDLSDQVDGAKFLVEKYGIDPRRIGIYGGSYGGFITFMALFTTPDVFACGAALRPVSDWAHYNHPYTSNILNEPQLDSLAYRFSSPIYHAQGLSKPLLICHGMIDTNVHFQDVARLAQRLIELGKENWEVAFYPLEGHGFKEPSSWTDEYTRIFKLFERYLK